MTVGHFLTAVRYYESHHVIMKTILHDNTPAYFSVLKSRKCKTINLGIMDSLQPIYWGYFTF